MKKRIISWVLCLIMTISLVMSDMSMAYAEEILPVDSYEDIENIEAEDVDFEETTGEEEVFDGEEDNGEELVEDDEPISEGEETDIEEEIIQDDVITSSALMAADRYWTKLEFEGIHVNFLNNPYYPLAVGVRVWYRPKSQGEKTPVLDKENNTIDGYTLVYTYNNYAGRGDSNTIEQNLHQQPECGSGYYVWEAYNIVPENSDPSKYGTEPDNAHIISDVIDRTEYLNVRLNTPKNIKADHDYNFGYSEITWDAVPGAVRYKVEVSTPSGEKIFDDEYPLTDYMLPDSLNKVYMAELDEYTVKVYAIPSKSSKYYCSEVAEAKLNLREQLLADGPNFLKIEGGKKSVISWQKAKMAVLTTSGASMSDEEWSYYLAICRYEDYLKSPNANAWRQYIYHGDADYNYDYGTLYYDFPTSLLSSLNPNEEYCVVVYGMDDDSHRITKDTVLPFKLTNDSMVAAPRKNATVTPGNSISAGVYSEYSDKAHYEWYDQKGKLISKNATLTEEETKTYTSSYYRVVITVAGYPGYVERTVNVASGDTTLKGTLTVSLSGGNLYSTANDIAYVEGNTGILKAVFESTNTSKPYDGQYVFVWRNNKDEEICTKKVDIGSNGKASCDLDLDYESGLNDIAAKNIGNYIYCEVYCDDNVLHSKKTGTISSKAVGPINKGPVNGGNVLLDGFKKTVNDYTGNDGAFPGYSHDEWPDARYNTGGYIYLPYENYLVFNPMSDVKYCLVEKGEPANFDEASQKHAATTDAMGWLCYNDLKANTEYTLYCYLPETATTRSYGKEYTLKTADHSGDDEKIYFDRNIDYTKHFTKCETCGDIIAFEDHVDKDNNGKCDLCGAITYSSDSMHIENIEEVTYTGAALKPTFDVYCGNRLLMPGKDYTIAYKNNVKAAKTDAVDAKGNSIAPTIVITGKGNYSGTETKAFEIKVANIYSGTLDDMEIAYTGKVLTLNTKLAVNGKTLKKGTDYDILEISNSELNNVDPAAVIGKDIYDVVVIGKGNYEGRNYCKLTVTGKLISKLTFKAIPNCSYCGMEDQCKPIPVIMDGKTDVTDKFNFVYSNNINPGTATVTITAKDPTEYAGTKVMTFKIVERNLKNAKAYAIPDQTYTGSPIDNEKTKEIQKWLVAGNAPLHMTIDGRDTPISYWAIESDNFKYTLENNINVGTAKMNITGLDPYTGSKTVTFKIVPFDVTPNNSKIGVSYTDASGVTKSGTNTSVDIRVPYSAGSVKPEPVLTYKPGSGLSNVELVKGKDYTLSYSNAVNVAAKGATNAKGQDVSPKIIVTFKGNFKGKLEIPYTIENKDIKDATVTWSANVAKYTGKDIKLSPTVTCDGRKLTLGKEYYISKSKADDESNAITTLKETGTVLLYIHGKGNYSGILGSGVSGFGTTVASTEFTITNKKLINELPVDAIANQLYCGGKSKKIDESKAVTPAVTSKNYIKDNARVSLSEVKDSSGHPLYDISYENNVEIGTATVIIKATEYNDQFCTEGEKRVTFKIVANNMKNVNLYKYQGGKWILQTKYPEVEYTGRSVAEAPNVEGWYMNNLSVYNAIGSETVAMVSGVANNNTPNIDYSTEWINAINVGTATMRIVGRNAYEGSYKDFKFKIVPCDISKPENAAKIELKGVETMSGVNYNSSDKSISVAFSDGKIKPEPILKFNYNTTPLVKGKDYTLSYVNAVNVATADAKDAKGQDITPKIVVTFKGNLTGKLEIPYTIERTDIKNGTVTWSANVAKYTGRDIKLSPTVMYEGKRLTLGKDYYISTSTADDESKAITTLKETGTVLLYIHGKGNYSGILGFGTVASTEFTITNEKLITELPIDAIPNQGYQNGSAIAPHHSGDIKSKGKALTTESGGFIIKYENHTGIGTATAIIKAWDNNPDYCSVGEKRVTFKIVENNIKNATLEAIPNQTYTASEIKPEINLSMKIGNKEQSLAPGVDYTVSYKNNISVGTATMTVTGKGKCTGTKSFTFKIVQRDETSGDSRLTVNGVNSSYEYSANKITPKPSVYFAGNKLIEGTDYTLSYKNNTNVADRFAVDAKGNSIAPTVVITFKGNLKGKREVPFAITKNTITSDEVVINTNNGVLYNASKNNWKLVPSSVVINETGKKLVINKDYEIVYEINDGGTSRYYLNDIKDEGIKSKYSEKTTYTDADVKTLMSSNNAKSIKMYVEFIGGYENGTNDYAYEYLISSKDISSTTITIADKSYTSEAITLKPEDIVAKDKSGNVISNENYVIVEDSYKNNINAGTASVTIKGKTNYVGTKEVKFKIKQQGMTWWEKLWATT